MRDGRHLGSSIDPEQLELLFVEATAPEVHSPRQDEGMVPPETVENPMNEEKGSRLALDDTPAKLSLTDILGPGLGSSITGLFARMELAEEEIDEAKRRDPANAERIHGAFRYLRPTDPLERAGDDLYRDHCREIIGRVAASAGERELAPGTRAEVLVTLSDLSLAAPLERTAFLLYGRLFTEAFPERARDIEPLRGPVDRWEAEQADELEGRLRRKLATNRAE